MQSILVTDDPLQTQTIVLPDQSTINYTLQYKPMQFGWFIVNLTYKDFTLNAFRVCTSGNFLNQFTNQLPFGLGCLTTDNTEPLLQEDFKSGKATLYLLTADECQQYEELISGQISP